MHPKDNAAMARHALNALSKEMGETDWEFSEEKISDLVANLMHLAAENDLDPHEMVTSGISYYEGDSEDVTAPFEGTVAYHATSKILKFGDVLTPGPHLHHVFATTDPEAAIVWGHKKDPTAPAIYVYEVEPADGAFVNEMDEVIAPAATVRSLERMSKRESA